MDAATFRRSTMKVLNALTLTVGIVAPSLAVASPTPQEPLPFEQLAAECAPDVHPTTLKAVVTTESSWNPYAIGVVNGYLEHQPRTLDEAIATAYELEEQGYNFSLGLGQVNRQNLRDRKSTRLNSRQVAISY